MTDDETFQTGYALSLTAGILILTGGFVRSFLWAAMGWENGLMGRLFGSPWGVWPSGVIGIAYGIALVC
jgi:hypothetical protein